MKARISLAGGGIMFLLGIAALTDTDVGTLLRITPAVPIYLVSDAMGLAGTRGLLWDSAHGPPFLNGFGVFCIYLLPGAFLLSAAIVFWKPRPQTPPLN